MFFAHNIPEQTPSYIKFSARQKFNDISLRVRNRMNLLESALEESGLRGEVFSTAILPLFRTVGIDGNPSIDSMSAENLANAAVLLSNNGTLQVPPRVEWPNCITVVDTAFVTNKEWEYLRMIGLGGSDSACVINEGYNSAQKIYHGKIGSDFVLNEKDDPGMEFIFDFGHKVEPLVIDEFCRRSGAHRVPETRMFAHKDYPFLTANIDQIVQFPDGRYFVFEAKTTTFWNKDKWENGQVPRCYIPQCRKYPLVLNDDRICGTFIGCIFGNTPSDFYCSFIDRDKEKEQEQMETEVEFWTTYVLGCEEPPSSQVPDLDLNMAKLKAGKAEPDVPPIQFPVEEFGSILSSYNSLQADLTAANKRVDVIQSNMKILSAKLIEALGSATEGRCPCPEDLAPVPGFEYEFVVSNKPRSRKEVNWDKLQMVFPQAYAECVVHNPEAFRVFSMKLKKCKN